MAKKTVKTYLVNVSRIGHANHDFTIEATSEKEAKELAINAAGSHTFDEYDADYEVEFLKERIAMKTYNSKDLFIVKVLEASTGHITKEDDRLLRREDLSALAVYDVKAGETEYGYLIYTGLEDETSIQEELLSFTKKSLAAAGFSDALFNLLCLARKAKCKFLQLDCDGVEYDDLPTFDW